ncbi:MULTISPECIES: mannitol dehydrogenase family protein [unclassified Leptolyngbya]|uniref:mannitol dehydrogenase family protein n=1 Tax=unclassified Leptolyngbya TaxID=2650499 RepID=UPI00168771A8|nr:MULTISPECIES: mannitol dehydrogenase family protein [unclassified Leptolyngbya]MBD1909460.1 mannitol dehydrogenase family protein [Leptolyngbya sp. FACHB-8]MBD2155643.1 mannitol dehydrogenase family protein [Leptolyngbya sp. FACHB-16]
MNTSTHANATIKLTEASLLRLPEHVQIPQYDRHSITDGIVHIGVGGFHRAHQALYLDNYFHQTSDHQWGICGVGLLVYDERMRDALQSQDCLYTLVERSPGGDHARIIGSITQYLFAPDNRQAVIDAMTDANCKIVSLTITEAGYYYNEGTGELEVNHPTIQHDLQHPTEPIGAFGYITAALDQRRQQGVGPFTVLSCDNLQGNGNIARKMLTAFANLQNPELGQWISENVSFPNSMVDRITPATTAADVRMVAEQFGIDDGFPVVAESFLQWVVEDDFCAGRPNWETVGVQMTDRVHPYELMKIRLLNASHLMIGFLGTLAGYHYVDEVMADPLFTQAVDRLMAEVQPTLEAVPGIDLDDYKRTLIERFSNPKIQDQLPRLCLNGAAKMPKFVLGSLRDALNQGGAIDYLGLTIAAWFRYLNGVDDLGNPIAIDDPMAHILTERAHTGGVNPQPLLQVEEVFGDLAQSSRLAEVIGRELRHLSELGAKGAIAHLLKHPH